MELVKLAFASIGATTLNYLATVVVTACTLGILTFAFKHIFSS